MKYPLGLSISPIIHFENVSYSYDGKSGDQALQEINLRYSRGEFSFLVGTSGAGKSTLLKLINRQLSPTTGKIWVAGMPAHLVKGRKLIKLRRKVGVVFQDFKLLEKLTIIENVLFALRTTHLAWTEKQALARAEEALEAVGLGERATDFPGQLSGGQQQRLAIARAIVNEPAVLIADEPTGNLDLDNAYQIMALLTDIARWGTMVLVATHNLSLVERIGARTVILEGGRKTLDRSANRTLPDRQKLLGTRLVA